MRRKAQIKAVRTQFVLGIAAGAALLCFGLFFVIPNAAAFGILWTLTAAVVMVMSGVNLLRHGCEKSENAASVGNGPTKK